MTGKPATCTFQRVNAVTNISHIVCGELFSLFLDRDGAVYSCGSGETHQLGHGNTADVLLPKRIHSLYDANIKIRTITAGNLDCAALTVDDDVVLWGW